MAAYLIALAKIKNPEKLKEYAAAAAPTIAASGGAPVARGAIKNILTGEHDGDIAFIAKFANAQQADDWYHSSAYQALIPTRDQAIDPTFIVMEEA